MMYLFFIKNAVYEYINEQLEHDSNIFFNAIIVFLLR